MYVIKFDRCVMYFFEQTGNACIMSHKFKTLHVNFVLYMGSPKPFSLFCGVLFQRLGNSLLWVDSNNYGFLWVSYQQTAFLKAILKHKHLYVGNFVNFQICIGDIKTKATFCEQHLNKLTDKKCVS